jgi:Uma2 family endonuclease
MTNTAQKNSELFSWNDYKDWPEDERWQIIDGQAYCMAAAPNIRHQKITGNFYRILGNALAGKPYVPFIAPTDVVFDDYNIVQPDVFVVCDKNKIADANIQGVPDLVIEVTSPSNSFIDKKQKLELYERCGVPEYLVVDPVGDLVERFRLVDGNYGRAEVFP